MIYFIRNTANGAVKIGRATDPPKRLLELQVGCPDRLELLGTLPGGAAKEKELHRRFARYRLRGEWFRGVPALLSVVGPPPTDPEAEAVRQLTEIVEGGGSDAFALAASPGNAERIKALARTVHAHAGPAALGRVYRRVRAEVTTHFPGREGRLMMAQLDWRFDGVGGWFA